MNKKPVIRIIKILLMILALAFLGVAIYMSWDSVAKKEFSLRPGYLAISLVFCLAFFFLQAIGWRFALLKLGHPIPKGNAISTWFVSQIVKYVPGKVMLPLYRTMYCGRCGVPTSRTLLSIMIELVLMVVSSALVFVSLLPFLAKGVDDRITWPLLVLCCVGGMIVIHPKVMNFGVNLALKVAKKEPVVIDFSYRSLLWLLLLFVLAWLVYGLSAVFNVLAVAEPWAVGMKFSLAVTAGFAVSWLIGFLSFLTPGGVGVREAVLATILAPYMTAGMAATVAVLSRLVWIVGECTGTLIMLYWRPKEDAKHE